MLAKNLGAVDEKRSQVFVPLHKAQFRAAKHRHIAPLGVQVIHRCVKQLHVYALALLDLIIDDGHDALLGLFARGGPFQADIPAGDLIRFRQQGAVRCQNPQLMAPGRLGIRRGQARHVQYRYRQGRGQAVIKIMRGVAGNGQHGSTVAHQADAVLLHHIKGVILAFAHNKGCAVRGGRARGDDDINVVLIFLGGGMVGDHLVQVAARRRAKAPHNSQYRVYGFCCLFRRNLRHAHPSHHRYYSL